MHAARYFQNKHVDIIKEKPHFASGHYVDFPDGRTLERALVFHLCLAVPWLPAKGGKWNFEQSSSSRRSNHSLLHSQHYQMKITAVGLAATFSSRNRRSGFSELLRAPSARATTLRSCWVTESGKK